jgi:hypothetical protein
MGAVVRGPQLEAYDSHHRVLDSRACMPWPGGVLRKEQVPRREQARLVTGGDLPRTGEEEHELTGRGGMHRVGPTGWSPEHHEGGCLNGLRHVERSSRRSEFLWGKGKVQVLEARPPVLIGIQANVPHRWSMLFPIGVEQHKDARSLRLQ